MRNFIREAMFTPCALMLKDKNTEQTIKAFIINFSRMGALISTQYILSHKKYISLMYRNEKNELIRMLTYVVHSQKQDHYYISGLQFVGIEGRK
ncbi:MAG: PilZ domain-containing protein [Bdellovibrionota bacterium]